MIPRTLAEQMADLYGRIAEIERRDRNRKRSGTVAEVDHEKGLYRVKLSGQGGKPYLTGWIRPKQLGAGLVKIDVLLSEGEQVDVVSETGDLTDAQIDLSGYSQANPRENSDTPLMIRIGTATLAMSEGEIVLKAGKIRLEGDIDHAGGYLRHNGTDVGDTHRHGGIERGDGKTDAPE